MSICSLRFLVFACVLTATIEGFAAGPPQGIGHRLSLGDHWTLQSSAEVKFSPVELSQVGAPTAGWHPTRVPNTVLGALVEDHTYADPYFGMNLRNVPGTSYPIGANFAKLPMPFDSPFRKTWYYRTEFDYDPLLSASKAPSKNVFLHLDGVNYRASVYLNGRLVATPDLIKGMYRVFDLDVTGVVVEGRNALLIEVTAPAEDDLASGWVDWAPEPADKNMGLYRDVYLTTSGPVSLRNAFALSDLQLPSLSRADLTLGADLENHTDSTITGRLVAQIEGQEYSVPVTLKARQVLTVSMDHRTVPGLRVFNPRVWWPVHLGPQNLYQAKFAFYADHSESGPSDLQSLRFGIRKITSELTPTQARLFKINGKKILIRGGGWSPDLMRRDSVERDRAEISYVVDLGLNTIRMEGKLESDRFFDLADENGILIEAGWSCCDHWEQWSTWKDEDPAIARASLRDQILRLRSHPSLLVWLNGSDHVPTPQVEQMYLDQLKDLRWPNPVLPSATGTVSTLSGPSGVKMTGPYEYIAPSYWMLDSKTGGAFGYNSETSPGPAAPPLESLRAFLPKDHYWPIDEFWSYHGGGTAFKDSLVFADALDARYGKSTGIEDYAQKSQLQAYEGHRAMFEAYARNKYTSTGVIQWMLNNGWPSTIWHLYDYYLRQGGAYFGAKKANRLIHAIYSYDDASIALVNHAYRSYPKVRVRARIFNLDMVPMFSNETVVNVDEDSTQKLFKIPALAGLSSTYFVRLDVFDHAGHLIDDSFYWLSTRPEVLDWSKANWFMVPTLQYSDYTALQKLPPVELTAVASSVEKSQGRSAMVATLTNPSSSLAFFVHLSLRREQSGDEVLPSIWTDNYITLLPGETRSIEVEYDPALLNHQKPEIRLSGWNVAPRILK